MEEIDVEGATERVNGILHPTDTTNSGPGVPQRKRRSDAGIPKKPPVDPDEITLKLKLQEARDIAIFLGQRGEGYQVMLAGLIQDQVIQQLQKKLAQLSK